MLILLHEKTRNTHWQKSCRCYPIYLFDSLLLVPQMISMPHCTQVINGGYKLIEAGNPCTSLNSYLLIHILFHSKLWDAKTHPERICSDTLVLFLACRHVLYSLQ